MKLTLKKYKAAKEALVEMKVHQKTIKEWEEAMAKVGDVGNQRVTMIKEENGKITIECEPNGKPAEEKEKGV